MTKENFTNFDNDSDGECFENNSETDYDSTDETSSYFLLHHKKRKVIPIK